jgi:hypothetical protein
MSENLSAAKMKSRWSSTVSRSVTENRVREYRIAAHQRNRNLVGGLIEPNEIAVPVSVQVDRRLDHRCLGHRRRLGCCRCGETDLVGVGAFHTCGVVRADDEVIGPTGGQI